MRDLEVPIGPQLLVLLLLALEYLSWFALICTKKTDMLENSVLAIFVIMAFIGNGLVFVLTICDHQQWYY